MEPAPDAKNLSTCEPVALAIPYETKLVCVIGVPDPQQPPMQRLFGSSADLLGSAIPEHELDGVDVTLEQPTERQASEADNLKNLVQSLTGKPGPSKFGRQRSGEKPRLV